MTGYANIPPLQTPEAANETARQIEQQLAQTRGAERAPQTVDSRYIDMMRAAPAQDLAKPHQRIRIRNTDERQTHHVADRHKNYHEILPGATVEIDVETDRIQHLIRLSSQGTRRHPDGPRKGLFFKPSPLKVIGLDLKDLKEVKQPVAV